MTKEANNILEIISITIMVITVALHSTGIHLLLKIQTKTNQRLLLMNLSAAELYLTLSDMLNSSLDLAGFKSTSFPLKKIDRVVNAAVYSGSCLLLIIMTIDRAVASICPLKYNTVMSGKRTKILLLCSWLASTLSSLPFFFLPWRTFHDIYYTIIHQSLQIMFLFFAIITYSLIFTRISRRNKSFDGSRNKCISNINKDGNSKFYLTAGLIILSFTLLVVLPCMVEIILYSIYKIKSSLLDSILHISWASNFMTDAIIYILLQPKVRNLLRKKIADSSSIFIRNKTECKTASELIILQPLSAKLDAASTETLFTSQSS